MTSSIFEGLFKEKCVGGWGDPYAPKGTKKKMDTNALISGAEITYVFILYKPMPISIGENVMHVILSSLA